LTKFDLPPPPPNARDMRIGEAIEAFLAALAAAGASAKTVRAYRAALRDFLEFVGNRAVREIGASDVAGWVYDRLSKGLRRPRGDSGRARRMTMHYYTLFLRSFFQWLGVDVKVPVVRKPRRARIEALSPEEVERLISASRDVLDLLIVALLFETGLRAREAVGIRVKDVDMSRREIRVRDTKYGEERIVLYGPLTEQALSLWLTLKPRRPSDPLLGISYSGLYKRLKSLARRAGIDPERVRPHVLRHTFATEALRRGIPLPMLQRLLGHRDIKVTQVYLHVLNDDIRAAYQRAFGYTIPQAAWPPPPPPQYPQPYIPPQAYMQPAPGLPGNAAAWSLRAPGRMGERGREEAGEQA